MPEHPIARPQTGTDRAVTPPGSGEHPVGGDTGGAPDPASDAVSLASAAPAGARAWDGCARLEILPLTGMGEVAPGDDLAELIATAGKGMLRHDDILVVTSKVVSKAEGRLVETPTDPAGRAAARQAAIDTETVRVVASRGDTRIVQTRHGLVLAAAGVDASNVRPDQLVLLPVDPDASARALRQALIQRFGLRLAVVITDTMGRTWRAGQTDVAIGSAGLPQLRDWRGRTDPYGNQLSVTATALIDELAAAADLVKGKTTGVPVAIVRGLGEIGAANGPGGAAALVRPVEEDLFALGTAEARAAGRLDALTALRSGSGLAARPVPADEVRQAVGLVLGSVNHPRRWRFVHVASEAAREAVAAVRGLPWLRRAPALLAALHPVADQQADGPSTLLAPFAATGLVLTDIPLRPGDADRLHDALHAPAGWRLALLYAVGYPADPLHPAARDTTDALIVR